MVRRSVLFILTGTGLAVFGLAVAVLAILLVRLIIGTDSFAAIGLGFIAAFLGYAVGIIAGLYLLRRVLHRQGALLVAGISVLVWAVAGFFMGILFNEINLNPWVMFIIFYAALPFIGLGAYSFKRIR